MFQGHSKDLLFGGFGLTTVLVLLVEGLLHLSLGSDVVPK